MSLDVKNKRNVTVVIPTHKRPELMRRALASITSQSFDGYMEVIIVFDACEVEKSLEESNEKLSVKTISNTFSRGLAGTRNSGIKAATCDWIAFCDDDDEWIENKLEKQFSLIEKNPNAKFCITGAYFSHNSKETKRIPDSSRMNPEGFFNDRMAEVTPISMMMERQFLLEKIGLIDEEIPGGYGEDYDFLLRTIMLTEILVVPEPLVRYYQHEASYYVDRWKMIDTALEYLLEKYPEFDKYPKGKARVIGQQAIARAASKDRRGALSKIKEAFSLHPLEQRLPVALLVLCGVPPKAVSKAARLVGKGL